MGGDSLSLFNFKPAGFENEEWKIIEDEFGHLLGEN